MGCGAKGPSGCDDAKCDGRTLAEMVTWYRRTILRSHNDVRDFYRAQPRLSEAIRVAAMAVLPDGVMDNHQHRVGRRRCAKAAARLLARAGQIEACTTFHDLLKVVTEVTEPVDRFGPLACYDTSIRIGAFLNLRPDRVYLHCGTKEGAKALGLDVRGDYLEITTLPRELRSLAPEDIENLLCLCKVNLRRLRFT
jgi:hypothetical protein